MLSPITYDMTVQILGDVDRFKKLIETGIIKRNGAYLEIEENYLQSKSPCIWRLWKPKKMDNVHSRLRLDTQPVFGDLWPRLKF